MGLLKNIQKLLLIVLLPLPKILFVVFSNAAKVKAILKTRKKNNSVGIYSERSTIVFPMKTFSFLSFSNDMITLT